MSVVSNLFPPIVKDAENAFIRNEDCNIYFSLSSFNSPDDIKHVQVTLINQKTNQSAFKSDLYPLGIKFISSISIVENPIDDYKYYITIANEDVINNVFELNQFYKVQIRFGNINLPPTPTAAWINDNIDYFSEWSQVCLIKGIEQPHISINTLDSTALTTFLIPPTAFIGKLYYQQNANLEKEALKSYNITIYKGTAASPFIQSNQNYTDQYHPNEFYYELAYDLEKQVIYTLLFNYTTTNLYKETISFQFKISAEAENELHATVEVTPEEESGRMKINIAFKEMFNTSNNLVIKRTSAKTNFLQWDNIKILQHNREFQHLWYDTTIESGVWYKYRIQEIAENARISNAGQPVMCVFNDMFLTSRDKQLKLQFNPTVSDFRYNVNESQQITLGSQFPFIKRNGNNYYRSFSISGLVSALMDQQGWYNPNYNDEHGYFYHKNVAEPFTTAEQLYGEAATALYDVYNQVNNVTPYQDYIYERQFRQKVMDYLYQNNVKLFRSLTQGNILVKLTNISLSPIDTLGRMLYSFTATATEIDESTLENYNKYDLINKFYYTYATLSITDTFKCEKSLIDKFYQELPMLQNKNTDIMQLAFEYDGPEDIIVYAKPVNNKTMFRYVLNNGNLILSYSDSDPIAECYFWGVHLDTDNYIETNQYYNSTNEISNPIEMGVYYIVKQYVYYINNYVEYFANADLLGTYPEETVQNTENNYALLAEPEYYKMIYYNGEWYPFSENQDIMIDSLDATIEYLYRIKKEG